MDMALCVGLERKIIFTYLESVFRLCFDRPIDSTIKQFLAWGKVCPHYGRGLWPEKTEGRVLKIPEKSSAPPFPQFRRGIG
jgi:hypothetical protein